MYFDQLEDSRESFDSLKEIQENQQKSIDIKIKTIEKYMVTIDEQMDEILELKYKLAKLCDQKIKDIR